jgi:hypothetical protein
MDYLSNYGNDESAKKLVGEILDQFGWDAAEWGRLKLPTLLSRCACFSAFQAFCAMNGPVRSNR